MVAEITEASKEQSNGIDQVNLAITEMDKVVQQSAANSEESASAAEEMNAQAEQLNSYVGDLVMMVTGKASQGTVTHHTNPASGKNVLTSGSAPVPQKKMLTQSSKEIRPDQVIPFDEDEDFKDF